MSEGPTRTGSIDAKIGATARELFAVVAEAKAAVKDLTATDPTVKVDANVAEALTKLSAVQAAQERLGVSSEKLAPAQARLRDLESSGTASATRLQAARLAVTQATIAHRDSVLKLAAAQQTEAAASEAEGEGAKRAADQHQRNGSYLRTIALLVAGLTPLLGPLAGYLFGVAAAAGVMGAAGVAAVLGIRQEMAAGTQVGRQYSAGLQAVKADLSELGNTAAVAMLDEFNRAAGTLHQSLPELNADVRLFSTLIGQGGNLLLQTLVKGLQVANPLLVQGGVYINQLAAGLLKWTSGTGFQSFVAYAAEMLPRVSAALGELAGMLIHVLEATSPIGTVGLAVLQALSAAINTIPTPVLTALIAAAGAGYLTFMLFKNVPPVIDAVSASLVAEGAAADVALGPLGILVGVIAAIGSAAALTAVQQNAAKQAQLDYTAAVQLDNGVIGKNTQLQAAKNLQMDGANKTARQLGISTDQLVKAATDQGDSYEKTTKKLRDQLQAMRDNTVELPSGATAMRDSGAAAYELGQKVADTKKELDDQRAGIRKAIDAYNELQGALGGTKISTEQQLRAQQDLADEYGTTVGSYATAEAAQRQTQEQLDQTTLSMRLQNDASGLLKQALDLLNGKTLNVAEAQTGMAAANNTVADSLKRNKTTVEGNSEAAVANQQAIQQSIQAADQYAQAVGTQTGSSEAARQALIASKGQMEQNLQSQGLLTAGVQAYIDRLFAIPASVPSTKIDADTSAAVKKLQELRAFIDSFNATTQARIDAGITNAPGQVIRRAGGGSVGDGPSGTVYGPGSSTSDGVRALLSRGEEVTNASAASYPGVRPLLKAINYDPSGTMAALSAPSGTHQTNNNYPTTMIVEKDPSAAFMDFQRRQNLRVR